MAPPPLTLEETKKRAEALKRRGGMSAEKMNALRRKAGLPSLDAKPSKGHEANIEALDKRNKEEAKGGGRKGFVRSPAQEADRAGTGKRKAAKGGGPLTGGQNQQPPKTPTTEEDNAVLEAFSKTTLLFYDGKGNLKVETTWGDWARVAGVSLTTLMATVGASKVAEHTGLLKVPFKAVGGTLKWAPHIGGQWRRVVNGRHAAKKDWKLLNRAFKKAFGANYTPPGATKPLANPAGTFQQYLTNLVDPKHTDLGVGSLKKGGPLSKPTERIIPWVKDRMDDMRDIFMRDEKPAVKKGGKGGTTVKPKPKPKAPTIEKLLEKETKKVNKLNPLAREEYMRRARTATAGQEKASRLHDKIGRAKSHSPSKIAHVGASAREAGRIAQVAEFEKTAEKTGRLSKLLTPEPAAKPTGTTTTRVLEKAGLSPEAASETLKTDLKLEKVAEKTRAASAAKGRETRELKKILQGKKKDDLNKILKLKPGELKSTSKPAMIKNIMGNRDILPKSVTNAVNKAVAALDTVAGTGGGKGTKSLMSTLTGRAGGALQPGPGGAAAINPNVDYNRALKGIYDKFDDLLSRTPGLAEIPIGAGQTLGSALKGIKRGGLALGAKTGEKLVSMGSKMGGIGMKGLKAVPFAGQAWMLYKLAEQASQAGDPNAKTFIQGDPIPHAFGVDLFGKAAESGRADAHVMAALGTVGLEAAELVKFLLWDLPGEIGGEGPMHKAAQQAEILAAAMPAIQEMGRQADLLDWYHGKGEHSFGKVHDPSGGPLTPAKADQLVKEIGGSGHAGGPGGGGGVRPPGPGGGGVDPLKAAGEATTPLHAPGSPTMDAGQQRNYDETMRNYQGPPAPAQAPAPQGAGARMSPAEIQELQSFYGGGPQAPQPAVPQAPAQAAPQPVAPPTPPPLTPPGAAPAGPVTGSVDPSERPPGNAPDISKREGFAPLNNWPPYEYPIV